MNKYIQIIPAVIAALLLSCGNGGENPPQHAQRVHGLAAIGENGSGAVTFAVFGNTGRDISDGDDFDNLINAANDLDIDFYVDLGNRLPDSVPPRGTGALWDTTEDYVDVFDAPVYPAVGSNDVFDYYSDVEYSERFGAMWYSFERAGTMFIVLNTEDDAYRSKFGNSPRVGDSQLAWLWEKLDSNPAKVKVLFMNRPLWDEAPEIWNERILPFITAGNVKLMVTCYDRGLHDWGKIDRISAVSTGCTGSMNLKAAGLFPHFLIVTVDNNNIRFRVLLPDETILSEIPVDREYSESVADISSKLILSPAKTDVSWNTADEMNIVVSNPFGTALSGAIGFTEFPTTSWNIEPQTLNFSVDPGVTKMLHLGIRGSVPELGPLPEYISTLRINKNIIFEHNDELRLKIPRPRTGEVISVEGEIAEFVPYAYDGSTLTIPIDIQTIDTCGRLIIYNESGNGISDCVYVSPLRDLRLGINEFTWNGHSMNGQISEPSELIYRFFIYNKQAPVTWVAGGPPNRSGTFEAERKLSGLRAITHDGNAIRTYRLEGSIGMPESDILFEFGDITDNLPLTGFSCNGDNRYFLGTESGIVSVYFTNGSVTPDRSFGDNGYVVFTEYRGCLLGPPKYHNGVVYIGIGGSGEMSGNSPKIILLDSETGERLSVMDLREFYGTLRNPPAVNVTEHGVYCAHPNDDSVVMLAHYGDALWVNGPGDRIGDKDVDGRSSTWGIGVDKSGFSYVNTPGYSARCGVLGPDGRGLFRVILVQLPGLRISSVFPIIEGLTSDGLYFVTRGGDIPYVFHVPFTVKTGRIVDKNTYLRE